MRLALLAVLAAAGERGVSRERLIGLFWPDSDENHARHSLRQSLYGLRQDLACEVINSVGPALSVADRLMSSDAAEFQGAIAAGERV